MRLKEYALEIYFLNEYIVFKKLLDSKIPTSRRSDGAEIASNVFCNPTSFVISFSESDIVSVHYDRHEDLICIKIPLAGIFTNNGAKKGPNTLRREMLTEFERRIFTDAYVSSVSKKDNVYEVRDLSPSSAKLDLARPKLFSWPNIKNVVELLTAKLELLNSTSDGWFFRDRKDELRALAKFMVAHSFLSFLLNVEVENIPSVIYEAGEKDKRSIGTLIVGYKPGDRRINSDERVMLRLISDKISSAISVQNAVDNGFNLRVEELRKKRKEHFKKLIDKEIVEGEDKNELDALLHETGGTTFTKEKRSHRALAEFLIANRFYFFGILPVEGKPFNKYRLLRIDGTRPDTLVGTKTHLLAEVLGVNHVNLNVDLIDMLLQTLPLPDTVNFDASAFSLKFSCASEKPFEKQSFISSLNGTRDKGRGDFCEVLFQQYKDLLLNCNLQIVLDTETFFDLEKNTELRAFHPAFLANFDQAQTGAYASFELIIQIK